MRYWDASALVPLIVAEPASSVVRERLAEDDRIATWVWSYTEIVSAVERRARDGAISPDQRLSVLQRLLLLAECWRSRKSARIRSFRPLGVVERRSA